MTRNTAGFVVAAISILMLSLPLRAHHSFAAQFDGNKPITLNGSVTKLEWMNPHIYFYLDVKDASGAVVKWSVEGGASNTLYRAGWRRDSLTVGDVVTVEGFLARDGSRLANMATVQLADGRRIFGLSSK